MTVLENLKMGAYLRGGGEPADYERVYELFPRVYERRDQLAGTLSGGEQQMVAMGRALMSRPRMLLMDEPWMALSPAHRGYVLATGSLALSGPAGELLESEDLKRAYLGG